MAFVGTRAEVVVDVVERACMVAGDSTTNNVICDELSFVSNRRCQLIADELVSFDGDSEVVII